MSTNFFSSLSGKFDLNASMSSLYGDYSQIKSGAYGSLMKSYVKKVGNGNALKAYQETGSTTTAADTASTTTSTKKSSASKSSFLDNHLNGIGKRGAVYQSEMLKKENQATGTDTATSTAEATATGSTTTTDKYSKLKSSWLDDQLKQYDKDATKTTAADTSVSLDTTV